MRRHGRFPDSGEQFAARMLACFYCDRTPRKTVIDCPDPRALAGFYCHVLGMRISEDIGGWVVIGSQPGVPGHSFVPGPADEPVLVHEYALQRACTGDSVLVIW